MNEAFINQAFNHLVDIGVSLGTAEYESYLGMIQFTFFLTDGEIEKVKTMYVEYLEK